MTAIHSTSAHFASLELFELSDQHWIGPSTVLMSLILYRITNINQKHTPVMDRTQDIMTINQMTGEFNHSDAGSSVRFDTSSPPFLQPGADLRGFRRVPRNPLSSTEGSWNPLEPSSPRRKMPDFY